MTFDVLPTNPQEIGEFCSRARDFANRLREGQFRRRRVDGREYDGRIWFFEGSWGGNGRSYPVILNKVPKELETFAGYALNIMGIAGQTFDGALLEGRTIPTTLPESGAFGRALDSAKTIRDVYRQLKDYYEI